MLLGLLCAALWVTPIVARASDPELRRQINENLVTPTAKRLTRTAWDREPGIVALYFGASWCGPCHAFTPELVRIRAALKAAGADTEVVYISLDESEQDMRRYMRAQAMPWPAIEFRKLRSLSALRALGGLGPPNLVLIDKRGEVLANGWQGHRYVGLKPVLEDWLARLEKATPLPTPSEDAAQGGGLGRAQPIFEDQPRTWSWSTAQADQHPAIEQMGGGHQCTPASGQEPVQDKQFPDLGLKRCHE